MAAQVPRAVPVKFLDEGVSAEIERSVAVRVPVQANPLEIPVRLKIAHESLEDHRDRIDLACAGGVETHQRKFRVRACNVRYLAVRQAIDGKGHAHSEER